ncbi:DnaJ C-terminal domain-containing protein [Lyngbya confervoides]|uniref:J domain-containing protein n=1 Tax=Lyngbya confervoides BDU141951 TaxID=1574623 RepID=A0ABD4T604_9CYAN|nr:J domain-containing protein [Lyngbya confervoides]MCM1984091.1 J domain-containing protein [Lyngbya confervoides BDU141951]
MQNFRNYYDILDVPRNASNEEIKRVYRKLARQYHPDLNPGNQEAEEIFKDINEAYDVLSDPGKRAQYDRFGKYWNQRGFQGDGVDRPQSWGRSPEDGEEDYDFSTFSDFQEFLDHLMGGRKGGSGDRRSVRDDPYRPGTTKTVYTPNSPGRVNAEARLVIPLEKAYRGGWERIRLEDGRSIEVNMPPGMISGQRIRVPGQGKGGGDLHLIIEVKPHSFFRKDGLDVICELPISPIEAVLGGPIETPTLDGWVTMNLPTGVRSGQRLRLGGKGYPGSNGSRGDQLVEIRVEVPKVISTEERELYEKLKRIETFKPRANLPL